MTNREALNALFEMTDEDTLDHDTDLLEKLVPKLLEEENS